MLKKAALLIAVVLGSSQIVGGLIAADNGLDKFETLSNKTHNALMETAPSNELDEEAFCKGLKQRLNSAENIYLYDDKCQKNK